MYPKCLKSSVHQWKSAVLCLQLLNCYLETYQHVTDPEEQLRLAQVITDVMHRRPQMDLTAGYFVQAYRDTIVCLQSHQQLIKVVLNSQVTEHLLFTQV